MLQELSPGSLVAERFEVERLAGAGGMGAVYRALDRRTQQPVAIKVLFDGADKARFQREALLLAELQHPGIVGYISHGHIDGGSPFLAMQWLAGQDLAERLRHGGLTLKETLLLARRVAEALSVAHQRGVVHRDIKPSNLFLVDGDPAKVVLLDFGIARRGFGGRSAAMTQTGAIVGTEQEISSPPSLSDVVTGHSRARKGVRGGEVGRAVVILRGLTDGGEVNWRYQLMRQVALIGNAHQGSTSRQSEVQEGTSGDRKIRSAWLLIEGRWSEPMPQSSRSLLGAGCFSLQPRPRQPT